MPAAIIKLSDSPVNMIAKAVANNGVVDMTTVALEAPIRRIEVKFINLPPGKLSAPAIRNHRKTPAGKARISGLWKMNATDIVMTVDEINDTTVALVAPTVLMPSRARTALVPNPRDAPIARIIPVNNVRI